jgi:hypothetical protein
MGPREAAIPVQPTTSAKIYSGRPPQAVPPQYRRAELSLEPTASRAPSALS